MWKEQYGCSSGWTALIFHISQSSFSFKQQDPVSSSELSVLCSLYAWQEQILGPIDVLQMSDKQKTTIDNVGIFYETK